MARGIFIDFHGQSWVKFISEEEVGEILEIEVFDMTQGETTLGSSWGQALVRWG